MDSEKLMREQTVTEQLRSQGMQVAVAESCTGGLLGAALTEQPGSSDYFMGGILAYANDVKVELLKVPQADLESMGAVSEAVAKAMAIGVREATGADWGVSTTGIAGPDGGTPTKPVGTVWIGLAGPEHSSAVRFVFTGDRSRVRAQTVETALHLLSEQLSAS